MRKKGHESETLLLVGNNHASGSPLFSTGSFRYLTDFFIFSLYGLLLFFREDEPVMLVPMELQEAMARKYSWIKDIRISFNYAAGMKMSEVIPSMAKTAKGHGFGLSLSLTQDSPKISLLAVSHAPFVLVRRKL